MPLESSSSGYKPREKRTLNPLRAEIEQKKRKQSEHEKKGKIGKREFIEETAQELSRKRPKLNIEDSSKDLQEKGKGKDVSKKEEGEITSRERTPENIRIMRHLDDLEAEMDKAAGNNDTETYETNVRKYMKTCDKEYKKATRENDTDAIALYRQRVNAIRDSQNYVDYEKWKRRQEKASS